MKRLLKKYSSVWLLILAALLLSIFLLPYYFEGNLILGGEGDNFLDFSVYWQNFAHTWLNYGLGLFAISFNSVFANVLFLSFLERFITDPQMMNFLVIFLIYYLPFLMMFGVGRQLKMSAFFSFLIATFYIVNPFTVYLLLSLNQWNLASLFIIPAFFWLIVRYYHTNLKLFFFFGLLSLIFAFANTNPPLMGIIQISILLSIIIASCYLEEKIRIRKIIGKYLLVLTSFFTFNFWWIVNWLYIFFEARAMYTPGTALSWLFGEQRISILYKLFLLKLLIPDKADFNYLANFYNIALFQIILIIPIFLILFYFLIKKKKKKHFLVTFLFLLFAGFLVKGTRPPFGGIYIVLIKYLPLFSIFKTSAEKWGVLFIFFISLLLIFSFKRFEKLSYSKWLYALFVFYLLFCSFPFVSGNFIPDYKIDNLGWGTRKFKEKREYRWLRETLNSDPEDYRVLSLPGSFNYQVALHIYADKYYTGLDPLINNINKASLTAYNSTILANHDVLFDDLSSFAYKRLLGIFNVRKVILNLEMFPWFGFRQRETIEELEARLDEDFISEKKRPIILYENDEFLPRFYIPDYQIFSLNGQKENLVDFFEMESRPSKTVIFFRNKDEPELRAMNNEVVTFAKTDKIAEGELIRSSGDPEIVFFPYVRWKPTFFLYPLVAKKEVFFENFLKDSPQSLFEKKLFYAAKRISEIEKFYSGYEIKELEEQMEKYRQKMREAYAIAINSRDKNQLLRIRYHLEAHRERVENFRFPLETISQMETVFDALKKEMKIKRNYTELVYQFNLPVEGEYEIMAKIDDDFMEQVQVGEEKIVPESIDQGDWYSFGEHPFPLGENSLVLSLKESPNLVDSDGWQEVDFTDITEGKLSFSKQNIISTNLLEESFVKDCDEKNCIIFPAKGSQIIGQEIKDYKPNSIYRIQFDFFNQDAVLGMLVIRDTSRDERTGKIYPSLSRILPRVEEEKMSHADYLFRSKHNASASKLLFYMRVNEERKGEAGVENIRVQRVYEPELLLKRTNELAEMSFPSPTIAFQKINPTQYRLKVNGAKDPFKLVFSESYHRGWKAYVNQAPIQNQDEEIVADYFDGQIKQMESKNSFLINDFLGTGKRKPIPEERHTKVNGFANVWEILPEDADGASDYELIIEYYPQRFFYWGLTVSLIAILISGGLWGIKLIKRKVSK